MRRFMLVSGALCGCLGPVHEGLEAVAAPMVSDAGPGNTTGSFVAGAACGPSEAGDPQHLVQAGELYQRPTCDLEAMNRPSTAPARPLSGVDAPTPELAEVAQLMVGQWRGTQTTPWDGTHAVLLTFFENGRYSGTASDTWLFYYGEACAYHRDLWRLEYGSRALAFGQLQMAAELGSSCIDAQLRRIQADAKSLRFDLFRFDGYGPVTFDLQRQEVTP